LTVVAMALAVIVKALPFNYATDRAIPQGIDRSTFDEAFGRRD